MSERVLPTEPGAWWIRLHGVEQVVQVKADSSGWLYFGTELDVRWHSVEWLEPVAPLGTVAELAAMKAELAELKRQSAPVPSVEAVQAIADELKTRNEVSCDVAG